MNDFSTSKSVLDRVEHIDNYFFVFNLVFCSDDFYSMLIEFITH